MEKELVEETFEDWRTAAGSEAGAGAGAGSEVHPPAGRECTAPDTQPAHASVDGTGGPPRGNNPHSPTALLMSPWPMEWRNKRSLSQGSHHYPNLLRMTPKKEGADQVLSSKSRSSPPNRAHPSPLPIL